MIIVGFVLLAAAAVVAVALIIQNPATVTVHAFNWSWDVDMRWLFVAGLALTAIGLFGLALMRLGGAHYLRLRRERKVLAAENDRLVKQSRTANDRPPVADGRLSHRPAHSPVAGPPPAAMPEATLARPPARPGVPTQPVASGRAAPEPMAPATGSVAAAERPATTSSRPHGLRERLAATRHRHEKE